VDKEGNGKSDIILKFSDGYKAKISFESILKIIEGPGAKVSAESCQNMNTDEILYYRCAVLHGQKLAVVRKYNWLRGALSFLVLSVPFLCISLLFLVF
jgi:hypothetical protein